MGFKDALAYFRNRKNKKIDLDEMYPDCSNVTIKDQRLAVTIGQWLGTLPNAIKTTGQGFITISSLTADEYMSRKHVKQDELAIIAKRFANVLKMAGFGLGNDCTLSNFDDEELTFDCVFNNTGEIARMEISFGDGFEYSNELTIEFDNIVQKYDFFNRYNEKTDDKEDVLSLQSLEKETECGNTFKRYISPYRYSGTIEEGKYKIEIEITYPEENEATYPENDYVDEDKLESLLSFADQPAEIVDLYYGVLKTLKQPVGSYGISIKATRKDMVDEKEIITVTDAIVCRGSFLSEFTINKNGRIITVKPHGVWSYNSLEWQISHHAFDRISYSLNNSVITEEKLSKMPSPQEAYTEAKQEAESVRKLAKTLVEKKKSN